MDESFYFSLLRISIAQILKASGFDKCKPSILNILTDLYIQYFKLLIRQSIKFSNNRKNSNEIEIQDISQAMISIEFIKPTSFENYLDFNDLPKFSYIKDKSSNLFKNYNTKSIESFVEWIKYSESFTLSKRISEMPNDLIKNLMEKRKIDLDDSNDQDKKKRKYKEKQDYYNQLKFNELQDGDIELDEDIPEEELIQKSDKLKWLNYLIEKDLKLGHDLKFLNSNLFNEFLKFQKNLKFHPINNDKQVQIFENHLANLNKNDHFLINIDEANDDTIKPSNDLIKILPYNLKYDRYLLDDSIEQYIEYTKSQQDAKADAEANEASNSEIIINDDGIGGDSNLMFL